MLFDKDIESSLFSGKIENSIVNIFMTLCTLSNKIKY
jgi:hypothetical protein